MIYYTFIYSDTKEQVLEKKWKRRTTAERMMATLSRRFNRKMEIIEIDVETEEEKLKGQVDDLRHDLGYLIFCINTGLGKDELGTLTMTIKERWELGPLNS